MRVLVVAAHPDDEVLGAGGVLSRWSEVGRETHVRILGEGATSRAPERSEAGDPATAHLAECARDAAAILGVASVAVHGLPDNRFDSVDLLEITKTVENDIAAVRPDVVLTHSIGDLNLDHVLTARAVVTATRPLDSNAPRLVMSFEVLSSTEWSFGTFGAFVPDTFVEISAGDLERKVEALRCYGSELRPPPHPRSIDIVRTLAELRGSVIGSPYAEAFTTIRSVWRGRGLL